MAERKATPRHALQLEYRFDRLLTEKLTQVYQLLVPDKRWSIGQVLPTVESAEVEDEQNGSHLYARFLRQTEGESDNRQPDGGAQRVRRRKRI